MASSSGGVGVRHRDDRGEPAERGGAGAGLDRLGLLRARLAEVDLDVDEAGRDDAALGVEHRRARPARRARADLGDHAVAHEHVGVALAGLVEDAPAADQQHFRQATWPPEPMSDQSTAMRTATPFVTCSRDERARAVDDLGRDLRRRGSSGPGA